MNAPLRLTPEAARFSLLHLLILAALLAGGLGLAGCDTAGEGGNGNLREFTAQVGARPPGVFEVSCAQTAVGPTRQRTISANRVAPYELPSISGTSISVTCAHRRQEKDAAILVRILADGELVREREATGPFASARVSWPESSGGVGTWGLRGSGVPTVFDRFARDGAGTSLLDEKTYGVPSEKLADTLQAGQYQAAGPTSGVFFVAEGVRQRLFTPRPWTPGSSYFHFDTNSGVLMVPFLNPGRAFLEPDRTADVFYAMGWPPAEAAQTEAPQARALGERLGAGRILPGPAPEAVCRLRVAPGRSAPLPVGLDDKPNTAIIKEEHSSQEERGSPEESIFVFEFEGGWPEEAKEALRVTGRIWSEHLGSWPDVHVVARWGGDGARALGSAAPVSYASGFEGARGPETLYPVPMANAISGEDLNGAGKAEIDLVANPDAKWYYPADYKVPEGRQSFVTVMLHELAHGLGFLGTMTVRPASERGSVSEASG